MPVYEYECKSCGEITEAFQKFSDDPLSTCEHCGGVVKKLISHSSFHLKGSGWYVTDYGKKDTGRLAENRKTDAKAKAETATKKADSSAKKSDPKK